MKYPRSKFAILSFALVSLLFSAHSAMCAEKNVTPPPRSTTDGTNFKELLGNAQDNFDELYSGGSTAETLTYATTTNLNFATGALKILVLTGAVTFTDSNLTAGKTIALRITGGASSRNLTFPAGWVFAGATAPASLAASKTGLLVLRSFGTTDANVVALYNAQP